MRLLSTLCGMLLCAACFAQDKIEGIGPFKIGKMTTADLIKLMESKGHQVETFKTLEGSLGNKAPGLYELVANRNNVSDSPIFSSFCPQARVFFLPSFAVADVEIEGIYLTFFENKLYSFLAKSSIELTDAMKTKYGDPEISERERTSRCQGMDLPTKTFTSVWQNQPFRVSEVVTSYYDSRCTLVNTEYFNMSDVNKSTTITACSEESKAKLESASQQKRKAKLKDF